MAVWSEISISKLAIGRRQKAYHSRDYRSRLKRQRFGKSFHDFFRLLQLNLL